VSVRSAESRDIEALSRIWHDGWHDAHATLMPAGLTRLRTLENFQQRLPALLPDTRALDSSRGPTGFFILKGDELYQLYVAREARGTGVAQALIADAEEQLSQRGFTMAWLACAIGNDRAARFYEKCGWTRAGTTVYRAETSEGRVEMDVWRYEKTLA
jgi:GNAT superfamily N-acetyltransferase